YDVQGSTTLTTFSSSITTSLLWQVAIVKSWVHCARAGGGTPTARPRTAHESRAWMRRIATSGSHPTRAGARVVQIRGARRSAITKRVVDPGRPPIETVRHAIGGRSER